MGYSKLGAQLQRIDQLRLEGTPTALKFGTGSFTVMSWFKTTGTVMGRMVSMGVSSYSTGFDLGVNTSGTCSTGCVGVELGGGSKANTV